MNSRTCKYIHFLFRTNTETGKSYFKIYVKILPHLLVHSNQFPEQVTTEQNLIRSDSTQFDSIVFFSMQTMPKQFYRQQCFNTSSEKTNGDNGLKINKYTYNSKGSRFEVNQDSAGGVRPSLFDFDITPS